MTWVKMKVGISGGRGDGTDWPPIGGKIEVPETEAQDLISAGMAVETKPAEEKAEEPKPEPEKTEPEVETATVDDESEKAVLTTKRGPGRPRKNP